MMYVFICPECGRTRMVSLLRQLDCPVCDSPMANCELDFMEWVDLMPEERERLIRFYRLADRDKLCFHRPMPYYDHWERGYW